MPGFNLPPGVTINDIERLFDEGPCEVCRNDVDSCLCPECPECHVAGNPKCYSKNHLVLSQEQKSNADRMEKRWAEDADAEAAYWRKIDADEAAANEAALGQEP